MVERMTREEVKMAMLARLYAFLSPPMRVT